MQRTPSHRSLLFSCQERLKSKRWISAFPPQATPQVIGCQTTGQAISSTPADVFSGLLAPQRQKEALTQISSPFTDPSPGKGRQTSTALPQTPVHQAGCHSPGAAEEVAEVDVQSWRTSNRIQVTSISQGEGPGRKSVPPQEVQEVRAPHQRSSYKKGP